MRAYGVVLVGSASLIACASAISASAGIVETVRASFATGSDARAIQELRAYRASRGITPEYLEAVSWLARAELASRNYAPAESFARDIYAASLEQLKNRPLDREPHLPIALGAAIEIQGQLLTAQGRRSEAVTYLQEQARAFATTSIVTRIRKNLLLLTLEGKPAPALAGVALPAGSPRWCSSGRTGAATAKPKFLSSRESSRSLPRKAWCSSRPRRSTDTPRAAWMRLRPSRPPTSNRCAALITPD